MPDTCQTCDFFLDRGLASASSPPDRQSDLDFSGGICRRNAPQIVPTAERYGDAFFPKAHGDHWCGEFRCEARMQSPC